MSIKNGAGGKTLAPLFVYCDFQSGHRSLKSLTKTLSLRSRYPEAAPTCGTLDRDYRSVSRRQAANGFTEHFPIDVSAALPRLSLPPSQSP